MRWTCNISWVFLALAWCSGKSKAATPRHGSLVTSLDSIADGGLGRPVSPSRNASRTRETEQSLQDHRGLEADAENITGPYGFSALDAEHSGTAAYVLAENTEERGQRTGLRRGSRSERTYLAPMGNAPGAREDQSHGGKITERIDTRMKRASDATPTGEFAAPSHLQLGVSQIVDQLLSGMLGTGLNVMQGGQAGGQQPAMAAAAAPAFGPAPAYYPSQEAGLSTVEIILIISGSILFIGLLGLLVWLAMSKKKRRR